MRFGRLFNSTSTLPVDKSWGEGRNKLIRHDYHCCVKVQRNLHVPSDILGRREYLCDYLLTHLYLVAPFAEAAVQSYRHIVTSVEPP
jgi:hypothetical protein